MTKLTPKMQRRIEKHKRKRKGKSAHVYLCPFCDKLAYTPKQLFLCVIEHFPRYANQQADSRWCVCHNSIVWYKRIDYLRNHLRELGGAMRGGLSNDGFTKEDVDRLLLHIHDCINGVIH